MVLELQFYLKNFTHFTIYLHLYVAMHFHNVYYFSYSSISNIFYVQY